MQKADETKKDIATADPGVVGDPEKGNVPRDVDKELKETKERLLRALADFDNFRKRMKQEQEEFAAFALEGFLQTLLPIMDNFDRAVENARKTSAAVPDDFLKGIALIKRQFADALTKFGVTEIEALGKSFDPHLHEVVLKKKVDGKPEGFVVEVVQAGYRLHQRVLRPAMVIISE